MGIIWLGCQVKFHGDARRSSRSSSIVAVGRIASANRKAVVKSIKVVGGKGKETHR